MNASRRANPAGSRRPQRLTSILFVLLAVVAILSLSSTPCAADEFRPPTDEEVEEYIRDIGIESRGIDIKGDFYPFKIVERVKTTQVFHSDGRLKVTYHLHLVFTTTYISHGGEETAYAQQHIASWRAFTDRPPQPSLEGMYGEGHSGTTMDEALAAVEAEMRMDMERNAAEAEDYGGYLEQGWWLVSSSGKLVPSEDGGEKQEKPEPGGGETASDLDEYGRAPGEGHKIPGPGSWWEWFTGTVVAGAVAAGAGLLSAIFGGGGVSAPPLPLPVPPGPAAGTEQGALRPAAPAPDLIKDQVNGPDIIDQAGKALEPLQGWAEWSKDGIGAFMDFTDKAIVPAINKHRAKLFEALNMKDPLAHAYWTGRGINVSQAQMNEFSEKIGNAMWYFDVFNDTLENVEGGDSYIDGALKATGSNYLTYGVTETSASSAVALYEAANWVLLGGSRAGEITSHMSTLKEGANYVYDKVKDAVFGTEEAAKRLDDGHYGENLRNWQHGTEIVAEWTYNEGQMAQDLEDVLTDDDFYRNMRETNRKLWKPAEGSWRLKRSILYIGEKAFDGCIQIAEATKDTSRYLGKKTATWFSGWF
ncbi:MAG: hypothetical protein JW854_11500 [Actinobacteria bacterium]|nr:hypothetical protein [Actinomycetota bacterium]